MDVETQGARPRGEVGRVMLSLWAQKESRRVAGELREAGIPVLLLKGPDLQERLYGTPAAYTSSDVDVLVPRKRAATARRVLQAAGWRFAVENGTLWRVSRAASYDRDGFTVDLHWGLHAGHLPAWALESLERRLWRGARHGASGMLEPDTESLLVFLAVHAVGHRYERLEWVENVRRAAELVADWDEVWRIARSARVTDAVKAALAADERSASPPVLDGAWGRVVSGSAWVTRGHFVPASVRDRFRISTALAREGFGHVGRRRRIVVGDDLELSVPVGVFRPWEISSELAAVALEAIDDLPGPVIVDVGTGAGTIAITIAGTRRDARLFGTDVSGRAVSAARRNARRRGLANVDVRVGELLEPVPAGFEGHVDLIVTNIPADPPSAATREGAGDPTDALTGVAVDGLGLVRDLASQGLAYLRPGGKLIVMLLDWQWQLLREELTSIGYRPAGTVASRATAYRFCIAERS